MLGGCDLGLEENNSDFYRYSIIVESDLPEIHINQTNLDSTIVYPYTLFDIYDVGMSKSFLLTIYPIHDSGHIKLMMYGGISYSYPSLSFKDSLTIYTPIDTTYVHGLLTLSESNLMIVTSPNFIVKYLTED